MKYPKLVIWVAVGVAIGFAGSWFITASWKHLIFTAVFALLIAVGFDKARSRVSWARLIFCIAGMIGIAYTLTAFAVDSHIISVSRSNVSMLLATGRGFLGD